MIAMTPFKKVKCGLCFQKFEIEWKSWLVKNKRKKN